MVTVKKIEIKHMTSKPAGGNKRNKGNTINQSQRRTKTNRKPK